MGNINLPNTIKMVITDFDGVVTDNYVYIDENSKMSRRLNFKDIMAFSMLKKNGYKVAIISGEKNSAIELMAHTFSIDEIHQDIRVKIDIMKSIVKKYGLSQEEYLYIGDDVNDMECLEHAKYKLTVNNAAYKVKLIDGIQITDASSGEGAFREVVDCLIG